MTHDLVDSLTTMQRLVDAGDAFVAITLVDVRGSAPQVVGAKALVTRAGLQWGTVGGGKIEAAAVKHAQQLLVAGYSRGDLVVWNLQTDIGMTCGGEVKLFFEVHAQTHWPIAVYGAGHVSQKLVRLLLELHCHVTCIDPRSEWLAKLPEHPKLTRIQSREPRETVATFPAHTFFVLMSQGHATDLPVLQEILQTRHAPYVGVIGSRQKASVLKRELKAAGLSPETIDSFVCPLGLPLGNNTPPEIAISIAAQLLQVRDQLK